jgi:hypothetical protein
MVLNKVREILVWSLRLGSILEFLVTGTVMKKKNIQRMKSRNIKIFNDNVNSINQRDMEDLPNMITK